MPEVRLYIRKDVSFDGEDTLNLDDIKEIEIEKWDEDNVIDTSRDRLVFIGDNVVLYRVDRLFGELVYGFGRWYDNGESIVVSLYADRLRGLSSLIEGLIYAELLSDMYVEFGNAECECECS